MTATTIKAGASGRWGLAAGFTAIASLLLPAQVHAQVSPSDMPGTEGAVPGADDADAPEIVVEVNVSSQQMPVLVIAPATASDQKLAEDVADELQLTGLFDVRTTTAMKLGPGLPERNKWPGLTTAAVVVARSPRESTFPMVTSESHHTGEKDVYRRRELVEYPGSEAMTVPVLADAILEDVLGVRSHMSGQLVMTDASTRGERSVRLSSPDGKRGRRISGFGSLSRGAGFDKDGRVWYAAEDVSGKLQVFRERETTPIELGIPGYVQSVAFSPTGNHVAVSVGDGSRVRTWLGTSIESLQELPLPQDRTSLSPSVDDSGRVVHTVGPLKGPFSVFVGSKQVTAPGVWAAMPSFCSTLVEDRVVYMVRAGRGWHVRIKSLTNGATRTVATNAMSPTCSPDGRTVAFFSPDKYGKGAGIYLVSDLGGRARKVWAGQAAGLRWRVGEQLPRKTVVRVPPPEPESPPVPLEPTEPTDAPLPEGATPSAPAPAAQPESTL